MADSASPASALTPEPPPAESLSPVPRQSARVHLPTDGGLLAPSLCACCLAPGGEVHRIEASGGPTIVVQYCPECHEHASAARTRWLAVSLASALVGLAASAALVLAFGSLKPIVQSSVAGVVALLPALALLRRGPRQKHTAPGPAAWWRPQGAHGWSLVCTNVGWAKLVAEASDARWELRGRRALRWPWPVLVSAALVALSVPATKSLLGVEVRVLNRHAVPAVLIVDGRHRGVVPPSSAESPAAGLPLRLVAGRRHLQLLAKDGRVLADTTASLRPGVDHLLAVSPEPVCFWMERSAYGRASTARPTREPLRGLGPLWQLPGRVDTWFAPNPPNDGSDSRSSGGLLLALRQGRCGADGFQPSAQLPSAPRPR